MKRFIYIGFLFIIGCSDSSHDQKKANQPKVELADKTFFFGPTLDSTNIEILAECDCCASEILFNKDSSFIAAFYCLEGDSFTKGKFGVTDEKLTLTFAPLEVTKLNDLEADYDSTTYQKTLNLQVIKRQISKSIIDISFLNSKIVLTTNAEEKDYGIESKDRSNASFLSRLRKDSVLHYLKID
jgi:hypothetical protein